jgi:DNA polymerase III alpha subunit
MKKYVGRRTSLVGWYVTGKIVTTKDNDPMEFVSFEDTSAIYETVFFPEAYARFCHMISYVRPYILTGKIEEEYDAVTMQVETLKML